MKYFKNYDIIYVKQKNKGIFIVIGLYPNETDRERSGARAPLLFDYTDNVFRYISSTAPKAGCFRPVEVKPYFKSSENRSLTETELTIMVSLRDKFEIIL